MNAMNDWRPKNGYLIYDGTYGKLESSDSEQVFTANGVDVTLCWSGEGVNEPMLELIAYKVAMERLNGHTTTRGTVGHSNRAGATT